MVSILTACSISARLSIFLLKTTKSFLISISAWADVILKLGELDAALYHFVQSMRFKQTGAPGDDKIFYQMSRVYARQRNMRARMQMLETAYEIAPDNPEYSLELGPGAAATNDRTRAIFHLERYLAAIGRPPDDPRLYLVVGNLNEDYTAGI
jgi:tetratricopeptide (TPR) repeat protein